MVELAGIVVLGIIAQWIAWRIQMPAILPLIAFGLVIGPILSAEVFLGYKLIDPTKIIPSDLLNTLVSLSVGVILFEGGLTLKIREVKQVASVVRNLLILGTIITLIGGGLAAHYFLGMDWKIAFLFGSLIIVTGPTVIGPILRNAQPNSKISTVLKWEGIVIDPVGAFVAVLVYEFILSGAGTEYTFTAIIAFFKTLLLGAAAGFFSGILLYQLIKRSLIPHYLLNVVSLGLVFFAFAAAEYFAHESGLLSVTVMGVYLANKRISQFSEILNFKETLTILLISILFIILSANINLEQLALLGENAVWVFVIVVFLLRPLVVLLSSIKSNLNWKEKLFIAWIGPRGIVAAAVSSIFALKLIRSDVLEPEVAKDAELLIPLTFMIILGTVVLQGTTAKIFAKLLGVKRGASDGYVFLGAHEGARILATYLHENNVEVTMVDTSHTNVNDARSHGLKVIEGNIMSEDISDDISTMDVGNFFALTPNPELNKLAVKRFEEFNISRSYRLISKNEMRYSNLRRPKNLLFTDIADHYKIMELSKLSPKLHEVPVQGEESIHKVVETLDERSIPVFLKQKDGRILPVVLGDQSEILEDTIGLIILGKEPQVLQVNEEELEKIED